MTRPLFDGETYDEKRDRKRLVKQLVKVFHATEDKRWHTLKELSELCGGAPEASVSARLRDLRKEKFGSYRVRRRYVGDGLWQYRVLPPREEPQP